MSTLTVSPGFGKARTGVRRPARAASAPRAVRPPRTAARLTRRGRLVLTAVFLGLMLAAFVVFGAHSAATGEAGAPVPTQTVQVGEGDTLWGLASQVAEPGHVREMILQIQELNALSGAALVEGQEIAIPVS